MSVDAPEELLRSLAEGEEVSLPFGARAQARGPSSLDRATRALLQLCALLITDAPTDSLRWAVENGCASGLDDATLVQVLLNAAPLAGAAQTVAAAPRLALALGIDLEADGWDGT